MARTDLSQSFSPTTPPPGLAQLARDVLAARSAAGKARHDLDQAEARADDLESQLIARLDEAGLKSIRLDDTGELLTVAERHYYSLPSDPADRAAAVKWLKRVGARSLFAETIHNQRLSAFCRERTEAGKNLLATIRDAARRFLSVRTA